MGYLNEFPHFESNALNLDWLLQQYSTFNDRIQEIQNHFDEVAEAMQQGIDTFEENVNNSLSQMTQDITDLQGDFDDFVSTVNQNFSDLTDDIRDDVNEAIDNIQGQITTITNNMVSYVSEHMDEWQVEATIDDHILKFSTGDVSIVQNDVVNQIQADGQKFDLSPRIHSYSQHGSTNYNDTYGLFTEPITLTEGTYVMWITQRYSNETYSNYKYTKRLDFDLYQDVTGHSIFSGTPSSATSLNSPTTLEVTFHREYSTESGTVSPQGQACFIFNVNDSSINVYPGMTSPISGTPYIWVNYIKVV